MSKLPVFEKNFYIEHPAVTNRPEEEADAWRRRHNITVNGNGVPKVRFAFVGRVVAAFRAAAAVARSGLPVLSRCS